MMLSQMPQYRQAFRWAKDNKYAELSDYVFASISFLGSTGFHDNKRMATCCLEEAIENNNHSIMAACLTRFKAQAISVGELEKSQEYFDRATALNEDLLDPLIMAKGFIGKAEILQEQKQWEDAVSLFNKGIEIVKQIETDRYIVPTFLGDFAKAAPQFRFEAAFAQNKMLPSLIQLGRFEDALKNALEALDTFRRGHELYFSRVLMQSIRILKRQMKSESFRSIWGKISEEQERLLVIKSDTSTYSANILLNSSSVQPASFYTSRILSAGL